MDTNVAHPPVATREEWLAQRKALLQEEKAHTRAYDAINAKRRRLPMVPVEKEYVFQTNDGPKTLPELFDGRLQLITQHIMFDPSWDKACPGCTGWVNALGDISMLAERNTTFVLVSRAPLAKLNAYAAEQGWEWTWVSSEGSDFNYDFHVSFDPAKAPLEYNYRTAEEWQAKDGWTPKGEQPGTSVFFRLGERVFHTYSCYQRGGERLPDAYALLDITPYGRQEDFEDSPEGWPQRPTYG